MELLLGAQNWRRYIFSSEETVNKLKSHYDNNIVKHTKRLIGTTAINRVLHWDWEEEEGCCEDELCCLEEENCEMEGSCMMFCRNEEAMPIASDLKANQEEEIADIVTPNAEICKEKDLSESSSIDESSSSIELDEDDEEDDEKEEEKMNFRVKKKKSLQKEKLQIEGNYIIKETPYLQEVIHLRRYFFQHIIHIYYYN